MIASSHPTAHHHHGTAEGSFTAKKWFGHRAGRSPCAHSIGKFFLCYILLFSSETSAPGSPGNYLYNIDICYIKPMKREIDANNKNTAMQISTGHLCASYMNLLCSHPRSDILLMKQVLELNKSTPWCQKNT